MQYSHFFFGFQAIKLELEDDVSCPGNYNEAPSPKSIPSYGWSDAGLPCLPGKFRSITLKLNSNTESACLRSGPRAWGLTAFNQFNF